MAIIEQGFGPHLMLDCRECDIDKISDLALVQSFLDELPELIGMTKIIPPYVFPYSGLVPEDKGITGVVIIALMVMRRTMNTIVVMFIHLVNVGISIVLVHIIY